MSEVIIREKNTSVVTKVWPVFCEEEFYAEFSLES